ncbi:hypothetical protein LguiA_035637 [Lonicera macranthoides]
MEWIRGPTIGRGSTATVSLATTASGNLIAVKSTDHSLASFLLKEQYILSQLCSPYIVEYIGFDTTNENSKPIYNLFLEYMPGGSLSNVIKNQGGPIDENLIKLYTHQILLGLDYLHSNNLVHCDIKSQNVLIGKDCAKIGDLGCAKFVGGGCADTSAFSGTPVFMSPEVARGESQGFPADVWALGCTIIEMATGSNPWPEVDDPASVLYKIGFSGEVPVFPRWLSEEAEDFLSKCLKRNVEDRWTVKQLLEHPFFDYLECDRDQLEECMKKSPTSVLDQCFWDSLEVSSEPHQNLTPTGNSSGSPVERIKGLVGPSLPNWGDEEDWITFRSNQSEEKEEISEQSSVVELDEIHLASMELIGFSIDNIEEGESFIRNDDLILECPVYEITNYSTIGLTLYQDFPICGKELLMRTSNYSSQVFYNLRELKLILPRKELVLIH